MMWVNIGGQGFHSMGASTCEPCLIFWYSPKSEQKEYVMVYPNGKMNPVLTRDDGSPISVNLQAYNKQHLRIDLARKLWDYVINNGWTVKGNGEQSD